MIKLFPILLISSICLTQEMEVDGDLKVTGNIQSQTIDSLLQVIQDLQNQITLLQSSGGWESRVFEYQFENVSCDGNSNVFHYLDFSEITNYDIDFGIVKILSISNYDGYNEVQFQLKSSNQEEDIYIVFGENYYSEYDGFQFDTNTDIMITPGYNEYLRVTNCRDNENGWLNQISFTIKFLITSNFPSESNTLLQNNSVLTKDKNGQ